MHRNSMVGAGQKCSFSAVTQVMSCQHLALCIKLVEEPVFTREVPEESGDGSQESQGGDITKAGSNGRGYIVWVHSTPP